MGHGLDEAHGKWGAGSEYGQIGGRLSEELGIGNRWSEELDIGGLRNIDGLKKVSVGSLDAMVGMVGTIVKGKGREDWDAVVGGLKKVSVGSLDAMVGMVSTIVKGKGREDRERQRHREKHRGMNRWTSMGKIFVLGSSIPDPNPSHGHCHIQIITALNNIASQWL
nr:hypothetical protein CFP56_55810 [Quercus suber]